VASEKKPDTSGNSVKKINKQANTTTTTTTAQEEA